MFILWGNREVGFLVSLCDRLTAGDSVLPPIGSEHFSTVLCSSLTLLIVSSEETSVGNLLLLLMISVTACDSSMVTSVVNSF